jgi:lipoprotein-releasing system permease protein
MPDVFVDRKIPIFISFKGIAISFLVPYLISSVFVTFALSQFKREHNLLDHIRSID